MVEDLAAAASNPAFRDPVLPRRLNTRAFWPEAGRLQEGDHIAIEFRVVIQDDVSPGTSVGKCVTSLLHDAIKARMSGDVEMQNPAPAVLDQEEAIQETGGQGGHSKEIHGGDGATRLFTVCTTLVDSDGRGWGGPPMCMINVSRLIASRSPCQFSFPQVDPGRFQCVDRPLAVGDLALIEVLLIW